MSDKFLSQPLPNAQTIPPHHRECQRRRTRRAIQLARSHSHRDHDRENRFFLDWNCQVYCTSRVLISMGRSVAFAAVSLQLDSMLDTQLFADRMLGSEIWLCPVSLWLQVAPRLFWGPSQSLRHKVVWRWEAT